jgi:hypothetical protein
MPWHRPAGFPRTRIERVARQETPVTADTALRLARCFGTTTVFWMQMQTRYDLERAQDQQIAGTVCSGLRGAGRHFDEMQDPASFAVTKVEPGQPPGGRETYENWHLV